MVIAARAMENQDEIVYSLIRQVFKEKPGHEFGKTQLTKLLFQLKKELPPDDPVNQAIPYYWFNYGPMCPAVSAAFEFLCETGELKKKRRFVFVGQRSYLALPMNVITAVKAVVRGFNSWAPLKKYVERIYLAYAPFEFMHPYRYQFLDATESYTKKLRNGQETLNEFAAAKDKHAYGHALELKERLYECELKVPNLADFDGFEVLFSSFVGDAALALNYLKDHTNYPLLADVHKTADQIWQTFVKGVRVQNIAHDRSYDKDVPQWRKDFARSTKELEFALDSFTKVILDQVTIDEEYPESETERDILSAVVDSYFSN
jgi:hypothetical protein